MYLKGAKIISYPHKRTIEQWLEIKNVNINNIHNLCTKIPLSQFVCVTGVSGSGKSSSNAFTCSTRAFE